VSRQKYNTDIKKNQWQYVKKIIPQPKRRTKRDIDRKEILNAVVYIVRTGCQWRNLPHDFPKWQSVANVFYQWRNDGTWKLIHDYLVHKIRRAVGKKAKPTANIIDSQSTKNDAGVCQETGYDAGKKIKGRKRHIVVDTLGLLQNVKVHSADIQDQDGAKGILQETKRANKKLQVVFGDSAYKRNGLPDWALQEGFVLQPVLRPVGVKGFVILPKRWIVERTLAWISRHRRHSKDYERNPKTSETMIMIAMIGNMLNYLSKNNL
jgi:putative transposase